MATNQGGRQSSYRSIGGSSGTYNEDAYVTHVAEGATGDEWAGNFIEWLQARTGSSSTEVNGLKALFAQQQGFPSWNEMNAFTAAVTADIETGNPLIFGGTVYTYNVS